MSTAEIGFLAFVVGALTVFGGVLAWACWMEWREAKAKLNRTSAASIIPDGRTRHAV